MSNQYHLLSELAAIIGISLNNVTHAGLEFYQKQGSKIADGSRLIKFPGDILNKIDKGPKYNNATEMFMFPSDFYNHRMIKGIKYILELRAYDHEHFINMHDICPPYEYHREPEHSQADLVRHKMDEYIADNLLDRDNFNTNFLKLGECYGDVYYLKLGLTIEGLTQLIMLEKMSGRNNDFLDVLEFLYYTCEE